MQGVGSGGGGMQGFGSGGGGGGGGPVDPNSMERIPGETDEQVRRTRCKTVGCGGSG